MNPLPNQAPGIVTYYPQAAVSLKQAVASVLHRLEEVAVGLWPLWLPGADGLRGGSTGVAAARALALELAADTHHFGPFIAELAQRALTGSGPTRFAPEVRAYELGQVIARTLKRCYAAVLIHAPDELTYEEASTLGDMCDWLAQHARMGVWLTGRSYDAFDRFKTIDVSIESSPHIPESQGVASGSEPEPPAQYPAIAGKPHPGSRAEMALETALAACDWANGRTWNRTFRPHTLSNPVRVDLLWVEERCVVEIDGPDHCEVLKFEADRRRDVLLQLQGFAVLRFTNEQVLGDITAVCSQIQQFILFRRAAKQTGDGRG